MSYAICKTYTVLSISIILTIIGACVEFLIYYPITSLPLHEARNCKTMPFPSPSPSASPNVLVNGANVQTFIVTANMPDGTLFTGVACLSTEAHDGSAGCAFCGLPYPYVYSSSCPALWQCSYCSSASECISMLPTNTTVFAKCLVAYAEDMGISLMSPVYLDGTVQFQDSYIPMAEYVCLILFCGIINGLCVLYLIYQLARKVFSYFKQRLHQELLYVPISATAPAPSPSAPSASYQSTYPRSVIPKKI